MTVMAILEKERAVPGPTQAMKYPMSVRRTRFWTNEHPTERTNEPMSILGFNQTGGHAGELSALSHAHIYTRISTAGLSLHTACHFQ